MFFSHRTTRARGVVIPIKRQVVCKIIQQKTDNEGRLLVLTLRYKDNTFKLANIYAPNDDSPEFFNNSMKKQDMGSRS